MPEKPVGKKIASQASFIFRGTVKKLGAATMRVIPVTKSTIIVQVDDVIEAPEALEEYAGQKISVEMLHRKTVKIGEQYVFYSNGWIFGESLAVQSIALEVADKPMAAAAPAGKPSARLREKLARARFQTADLVITGRVTGVRVPPDSATMAVSLESSPWKPVSEHDPMTQEAVIQVTAVHKGAPDASEVTLRFPRSTDVRWHQAPKFSPGQLGLFMLHKEEKPGKATVRGAAVSAALSAVDSAGFHTALHPADFQSLNEPVGLEGLADLHAMESSNQPAGATKAAKESE